MILLKTAMQKSRSYYTVFHQVASAFLITALLWLTVSAPFVFRAQLAQKEQQKAAAGMSAPSDRSDDGNPLNNTTEEKAPSTLSVNEEFIHHTDYNSHPWFSIVRHHSQFDSPVYRAYHGEPLCPPPNC